MKPASRFDLNTTRQFCGSSISSRRTCHARCAAKSTSPIAKTRPRAGAPSCQRHQHDGQRVARREHRLGPLAKQQRGRVDADQRVILAVLVRIDRVVADHPGDRPGVQQIGRQIEPAEHRRPAHQRTPGEGQAETDLRPIGESLHERIDRHHAERRDPAGNREAVELHQHRQSDKRLRHQECGRGLDRHLPGWNRSRARALDSPVEIAIDDVVPGAAGTAHREGTDQEKDDVPEVDVVASGNRREAGGPPAGYEQKP